MNKTARIIIDYCISNDIGTLIAGYNVTFQRNSYIGKQNNQNDRQNRHCGFGNKGCFFLTFLLR